MSASSYIHERRYCCKVSAAGHSIWSRIVVIKFEHGKLVGVDLCSYTCNVADRLYSLDCGAAQRKDCSIDW